MNFKNLVTLLWVFVSASFIGFSVNAESKGNYEVSSVVELTDNNFYELVKPNSEWMIAFTAKWCGACQSFKPDLEDFALHINTKLPKVKIGKIDVDDNPALSNQFMISRLPTVYHFKDSEVRTMENVKRDFESLKNFIYKSQYKSIEPYSGIFAPYSLIPRATFTGYYYFYQLIAYIKTLPGWVVSLVPAMLIGYTLYYISKADPQQTTRPVPSQKKIKKNK